MFAGVWIFLMGIFLLVDAAIMCLWGLGLNTYGLEFCNPAWWYKNKRTNIFGSAFVASLVSITILPYAICYWIYKLCTVGRR